MADKTLADWQKRATEIQIDGRAFINGRRVDSTSGETRTTINPANGLPLVEVANCDTRDAEDAVQIANDSIYGLAGAVWSRDINTAHKVADKVRVGTMGINNYFGGDITVPFGGFKESGNGRDKSMHAFDDYTELKTTWIEFD
jgi:acyl-CoA reductase-like NAD-dependent aldehyde dehydrogenase